MKLTFGGAVFALLASHALAASQWGFVDGSLSVAARGAGVGAGVKQKLVSNKKLPEAVKLGPTDTLKIILTTQEDKTAKKAHQAFLLLEDQNGLETSFALSVKESGKGKVDLTQKDIPLQLLQSSKPLSASLIIASFGAGKAYRSAAFELVVSDDNGPVTSPAVAPRHGQLPEIHHVFRADPKSPPKIITLVFTAAVLGALPIVLGAWLALGGNFNHAGKAMANSPIGHALYFGGIVAMQAVFAAYYASWNLFQTLPVALVVSTVILFAGSRALTEVQERRLSAKR